MNEVHITKEHHQAGYKVCTTCQIKVHVLREGCEVPHELCVSCGYSVVDKEAYLQDTADMVEDLHCRT